MKKKTMHERALSFFFAGFLIAVLMLPFFIDAAISTSLTPEKALPGTFTISESQISTAIDSVESTIWTFAFVPAPKPDFQSPEAEAKEQIVLAFAKPSPTL